MKIDFLRSCLNEMVPEYKCELNYSKDYELLIAVMLSAQCTDKRVNLVTESFFKKYDLSQIAQLPLDVIEKEIYSLGSHRKKASYMQAIAQALIKDYAGKVPNDFEYLNSLPGIGRKTCNVVLSELFDVPTIAVDTHVDRVAKRLGLASENDNVDEVEKKLMKTFNREEYNKINHQILLLGRYICTAKKPNCENCIIKCKKRQDLK